MAVKIRLARSGAKKRPFYRIVAADVRAKRDGRFIEKLGIYDPVSKDKALTMARDRVAYWISNGAQPTEAVARLLRRFDAGPAQSAR